MALIIGTANADTLTGSAGDDTFDSLAGNDFIGDGGGANRFIINFGYGVDTYSSGGTSVTVVFPGQLYEIATIRDNYYNFAPLPESAVERELILLDGTNLSGAINRFTTLIGAVETSDAFGHMFVYAGGPGASVTGTAANDILAGASAAQTLSGGDGNDIIYANEGADIVSGGEGNDYLSAGLERTPENDQFYGNNGIDTISYSGITGGVTIDLGAGVATGSLIGTDLISGFEVAVGSIGDDVLIGTENANTLTGSFGNDYFYGYGGNDLMVGGSGIDVLIGDTGNDVLRGDAEQDYLFGGNGLDTLDGGDGVDVLNDNSPDGLANAFYGGAGGDYIYAGAGADTAVGGDGNDIFVMTTPGGAGDLVHGEAGQDYFYMGDGADQLFGGAGVDVIIAAGGNDVVDGGEDVDYMWLGGGSDEVIVRPGYSAEVVNEFSTAADTLRFIDTSFATFSDVRAAMTNLGSYTIITVPDGSASVWVIGVPPDQFSDSNFMFA